MLTVSTVFGKVVVVRAINGWSGFSLHPCYIPFSVSVVFNFTIIKDYFRLCCYARGSPTWLQCRTSLDRSPFYQNVFISTIYFYWLISLSLKFCLLIIRTSYWPMETGWIRNERLATSKNKIVTPWNSMCFKPLFKLNRHFIVWRASWFVIYQQIYFTHELLVVDWDEKRIQVLALSF